MSVRLEEVVFEDRIGIATHAQLEVLELHKKGTVAVRAFTFPLRRGRTVTFDLYATNVFELHVQPILCSRPGEFIPVGQPASRRLSPGQFAISARFVLLGQLIHRTQVRIASSSPEEVTSTAELVESPKEATSTAELMESSEKIRALTAPRPEVSFSRFDYRDTIANGAAATVDLELYGSYSGGAPANHHIGPLQVDSNHSAAWSDPNHNYTDVTSVTFQPKRTNGQPYGSSATFSASPGMEITRISGQTIGTLDNPRNRGVLYQEDPMPQP